MKKPNAFDENLIGNMTDGTGFHHVAEQGSVIRVTLSKLNNYVTDHTKMSRSYLHQAL